MRLLRANASTRARRCRFCDGEPLVAIRQEQTTRQWRTIQALQAALDADFFLRIHRSMIVNLRHVKEIESVAHGGYAIALRSGVRLQSSRTYHDALKRWISNPL